jgi:hypothetical protein
VEQTALIVLGLVASLVLVAQSRSRLFAIIAVVASGLEALLHFHVVRFGVRGVPLDLVLGGALAVAGAILYTKVTAKTGIACATAVALVGAVQVLGAL